MKEKIADFLRSRKGQDTALVLAMVFLGAFSFALGRLSVTPSTPQPVTLTIPATAESAEALASVQLITPTAAEHTAPAQATKQYVASKNSSVFHLPWCSGAKRIKEANKIWFSTKAEAESAGYRPAANCKGI